MKKDKFDVKNIMAITELDYEGNKVPFDINGDIMVNATQMAKPFGKFVKDWLNLQQTREYVKVLIISREEISPNGDNQAVSDITNIPGFIRTQQGGRPSEQGTWINRKLAIRFAQWLNPAFAVWVDDRIEEMLLSGLASVTRAYVTQMIEKGILKLGVPEIKGLHGGTYVRRPNIYETSKNSQWYWEEFTLGSKKFMVPAVVADGVVWIHGPNFLRESGLVTREGDITATFASIDYRLMRRYSPFGKGLARNFIRKDALTIFGFTEGNQAPTINKTELRKRFLEAKEAMPGFESRLISLIDQVKTLPEKEFLIDLYKLLK